MHSGSYLDLPNTWSYASSLPITFHVDVHGETIIVTNASLLYSLYVMDLFTLGIHYLFDPTVGNHLHDPQLIRHTSEGILHFVVSCQKTKLGIF